MTRPSVVSVLLAFADPDGRGQPGWWDPRTSESPTLRRRSMDVGAEPITALDTLGIAMEAAARADETFELAATYLDPSLVDVLRILGFNREYVSAQGSHLYDGDGRAYLDFHTGEGFASLGHNHPDVGEALRSVMEAGLVD